MSLYATCPCGIPEGLDMAHLRTDCPHYGSTPETPPAPTVTGEVICWLCEGDGCEGCGGSGKLHYPSPNAPQAEAVVTGDLLVVASRLEALAQREMNNLSFDVEGISKAASCLRQHQSEVEALRKISTDLYYRIKETEARATKAEAENARLREAQERFLGTIQDRMSRISESDAKHADALIDELVRVAGYFRQAKDAQG